MNPLPESPQPNAFGSYEELQAHLESLRSSLEGLAADLCASPKAAELREALECLRAVDRSAAAVLEFAFPNPIQPANFPVADLVDAAVQTLSQEQRTRLLIDVENTDTEIWVDSKVFSMRLAQLLEGPLSSQGGTVFLHAHTVDENCHITLVWSCRNRSETDAPANHLAANRFQASAPFQLALRDMQRMEIESSTPNLKRAEDCLVLRMRKAALPGGVS